MKVKRSLVLGRKVVASLAMIIMFMNMILAQVTVPTVAWASGADVVVQAPYDGQIFTVATGGQDILVRGYVRGVNASGLTVNGRVVPFDSVGNWSTTITLSPGSNDITVVADGTRRELTVYYYDELPSVRITNPDDYAVVTSNVIALAANISGGTLQSIRVDGQDVGTDLTNVPLGQPGLHTIVVQAVNSSGLSATDEVHVVYNPSPFVTITSPDNGDVVNTNTITVTGTASGGALLEFFKAGQSTGTMAATATYTRAISGLAPGENELEVRLQDAGGRMLASTKLKVTYQAAQPEVYNLSHDGDTVYTERITFSGKATNTSQVTIVNNSLPIGSGKLGDPATPITRAISASGQAFSTSLDLVPGLNNITITAAGTPNVAKNITIYFEQRPYIDLQEPYDRAGTYMNASYSSNVSDMDFTLKGEVENTTRLYYQLNNGTKTSMNFSGGDFSQLFKLQPGGNSIKIIAENNFSNTTTYTLTVNYSEQPAINVTTPSDITNVVPVLADKYTIIGKLWKAKDLKLELENDTDTYNYNVSTDSNGNFNRELVLAPGMNTVTLTATGVSGNTTITTQITFNYTDAPFIIITEPEAGDEIDANEVWVKGRVSNTDRDGLRINDEKVSFSSSTGEFAKLIKLDPDDPSITVRASRGTRIAERSINLTYTAEPEIVVTSHEDKETVYLNEITVKGKLQGIMSSMLPLTLTINKEEIEFDDVDELTFSQKVTLKKGTNTIKFTLTGTGIRGIKDDLVINYEELALPGAEYKTAATSKGATLRLFDKELELKYPKGYLSETDTLEISVYDYDDLDVDNGDNVYAGKIFHLDVPELADYYDVGVKFNSTVSADAAHRLALFRYDSGSDEWVSVGGKVDMSKRMITAKIDEPGYYAPMVSAVSFNDVPGHWAQNAIELLIAKGVVDGDENGYFEPNDKITREQLAKMVVKGMNYKVLDEEYTTFFDINHKRWSHPYVQTAVRMGIVKGTGNNRFEGSRAVSRAELFVMLARAADLTTTKKASASTADPTADTLAKFADGKKVPFYARDAFAQLVNAGLINGDEYGRLKPFGSATRAEAAKVLSAIMAKKGLV